MNDHNLDDLIIDSIEPNHSKTKSFLTIVALLIVFLIVGIILAKIYTNESNNAALTLEENNSEMIAPELTLQAPTKVAKVKEKPSLSTIIEQEIKAPEVKHKEVTPEPKPATPIVVPKPVEIKKETVQITEEFAQKPQAPKITKPKVVEPIVKEPEAPKPVVKPVAPKPVKIVTEPKEIPKTVSDIAYYIQVGSFTKNPSSRFLSVIKNSGFSYTITKATSKGVKKLLIGPYTSRASVDSALIQVRDRINKKAFVVKK